MADFFQPGPSSTTQNTSSTQSPAQQALAEFKIQLLGQILNSMGGNKPSFKSFVAGGPATNPVPQGLGNGSAQVLSAMMQPGAFTSTTTGSGTATGATPSILSDLTQLGVLGALIAKSGVLGDLGGILAPLGGAIGLGGVNPALGDTTPGLNVGSLTGSGGFNLSDILGPGGGVSPGQYNTDGTSLSIAQLLPELFS